VVKYSLTTATDGKKYKTKFYNLDVIISVGYRVKSHRGTQYRIWATQILRNNLLKGYAIHERFERIEHRLTEHDKTLIYLLKRIYCLRKEFSSKDRYLMLINSQQI
jgi:hypothetical protein